MISLALATLLSFVPVQDDSDLVILNNGSEIPCRVLFENDERVVYRARRRDREAAMAEVAEVQSIERSMREFLDRFSATNTRNVDACTELALFAEQRYLFGEARNMWIRILTLDPENEVAWEKLGGVHGRNGWRLRVRGRHRTLDELRARASTWRDAMELPTAHFLLRTNIEPEIALDVAIDIERLFQTYYDAMGPPLELFIFDEVPEINIYSDTRDFPSPPTPDRTVWYERNRNVLHVNASAEVNRHEIVRQMTFVMTFNSFRRTVGGRTGSLPAWSREGLAQAFAGAFRANPGRARFDFAPPLRNSFVAQAEDDRPLSLTRVLSANFGAFEGGTNRERHIRQSYTLTHFLVFAEGGRYMEGYGEFLLSAFRGQGSATHLRRALGVNLNDLEAQWVAYVNAIAGG